MDRLYGAQYGASITSELTEDWDPHVALFDSLLSLLGNLEGAGECVTPVAEFQLKLLVDVGSVPEFGGCVGCGGAITGGDVVHFSSFEGGLLCRDCEGARAEKIEIGPEVVKWLSNREGGLAGAAGAFKVLDYHICHLTGNPPVISRMFLEACRQTYRATRQDMSDT